MKRRISLVIALVPSFLMMFGSIARAEETKVQTSKCTSKPAEIEFVKVLPTETKDADFQSVQTKVKAQILEEGEEKQLRRCSVICIGGVPGYLFEGSCVPCPV